MYFSELEGDISSSIPSSSREAFTSSLLAASISASALLTSAASVSWASFLLVASYTSIKPWISAYNKGLISFVIWPFLL